MHHIFGAIVWYVIIAFDIGLRFFCTNCSHDDHLFPSMVYMNEECLLYQETDCNLIIFHWMEFFSRIYYKVNLIRIPVEEN